MAGKCHAHYKCSGSKFFTLYEEDHKKRTEVVPADGDSESGVHRWVLYESVV